VEGLDGDLAGRAGRGEQFEVASFDGAVQGGLQCFEVRGIVAGQVEAFFGQQRRQFAQHLVGHARLVLDAGQPCRRFRAASAHVCHAIRPCKSGRWGSVDRLTGELFQELGRGGPAECLARPVVQLSGDLAEPVGVVDPQVTAFSGSSRAAARWTLLCLSSGVGKIV
jgi:hypothetical protein